MTGVNGRLVGGGSPSLEVLGLPKEFRDGSVRDEAGFPNVVIGIWNKFPLMLAERFLSPVLMRLAPEDLELSLLPTSTPEFPEPKRSRAKSE